MTLGELYNTIRDIYPDLKVNADGLTSYRGYYNQLAIEPGECSIHALQQECEYALDGGVFHGYKGGEYVMNEDTAVWYSAWGEASNEAVTGIKINHDRVVIVHHNISEYLF